MELPNTSPAAEHSVFSTMGIVRGALDMRTPQDVARARLVLSADMDTALRKLILFVNGPSQDQLLTQGLLNTPLVDLKLAELRTKVMVRLREYQAHTNAATQKQLQQGWRKANAPHVLGTVHEISVRYGISKSRVRALKAEGGTALDDYINSLSSTSEGHQ